MKRVKDKSKNRIKSYINIFLYSIFVPKISEIIWEIHSFLDYYNSDLSRKDISKIISTYHEDGIVIFPLNKRLISIVIDIRNKLIGKRFSNLEYYSPIDQKNLINKRPNFKKYRVDLTNQINPISFIKVLSSFDIYYFLRCINPSQKPRITYLSIWLDGVNHESFKDPTETRLFHRDGLAGAADAVKFFINLSNVEKENGPFTYVKGSHKICSRESDYLLNDAGDRLKRFTDESVLELYSKKDIMYLTGPAGTSSFADTFRGLHKGVIQSPGKTRVLLAAYFEYSNH